jgi:hypothetical protein
LAGILARISFAYESGLKKKLGQLGIAVRITKWVLKKKGMRLWTGFISIRRPEEGTSISYSRMIA